MIKPLFDNVLVKHEHKKETTSSGILLSAHEEESKYAVVVAIVVKSLKMVEKNLKLFHYLIFMR